MPFGVGAHPYVRVGDTATDDCTLQLAATTALPLAGGLPTGPAVPVEGDTDFRDGRPLKGLMLDDAFGGCVPAAGDELVRHRLLGPAGGASRCGRSPRSAGCRSSLPTTTPVAAVPSLSSR